MNINFLETNASHFKWGEVEGNFNDAGDFVVESVIEWIALDPGEYEPTVRAAGMTWDIHVQAGDKPEVGQVLPVRRFG